MTPRERVHESRAVSTGTGESVPGWRRDVLIIVAVALVVRLAYFFINRRTNPAFDYLIMDSMHIDHWAKAIASGHAGPAVYFRGPLYPYLLALIYRFTGSSISAAVLVNHLAGAAMCGFLYRLAREYFPRPVALVAGLVAAVYWPLVYFEGEILIEPVFILLVVAALWRLARAAREPSWSGLITSGVLLGLAALARPTILVMIVVLPFVFRARFASAAVKARPMSWARATLIVLASCVVTLSPAIVHNAVAGGAVVPVAWSGGLNFYIGNNPSSDGRSAMIPGSRSTWMGGDEEALAIAREQAGRPLGPAQASRFYFRKGLDFVSGQPGEAVELTFAKLFMFWEGPERSNEKYIYFFWDRFGLGHVPMAGFWLISPLALLGLVRLWPRRRDLALLYGFVAAYMVGVVAFFVVSRYRLPVIPVLIVFASWAAVDFVAMARERRWRGMVGWGALFVVLFLGVNESYPLFLRQRNTNIAISHYTLAAALADKKEDDRALVELARARVAYEKSPSRHYEGIAQDIYWKLGALLYQKGRCEQAVDDLGHILPSNPNADAARMMFADCCEKLGRPNEAGKAYLMILQKEPKNRKALEGLMRCYEATGNYKEAAKVREQLGSQ